MQSFESINLAIFIVQTTFPNAESEADRDKLIALLSILVNVAKREAVSDSEIAMHKTIELINSFRCKG